jgi:D-aminopeptidase
MEKLAEGESPDPFVLDPPVRVIVEFFTSDMADRAMRFPLIQLIRREGTRISFSAQDMIAAYHSFRALVVLASVD